MQAWRCWHCWARCCCGAGGIARALAAGTERSRQCEPHPCSRIQTHISRICGLCCCSAQVRSPLRSCPHPQAQWACGPTRYCAACGVCGLRRTPHSAVGGLGERQRIFPIERHEPGSDPGDGRPYCTAHGPPARRGRGGRRTDTDDDTCRASCWHHR